MGIKSAFKKTAACLMELLPKSDKKIIFESFSDYCDNSRAMFEYLVGKGYDKTHKLVWCVEQPERFLNKKGNNKSIVFTSFRNKKYLLSCLWHIATAKTIFYTHAKPPLVNVKKQTVICLWHGIPLKKISLGNERAEEAFSFLPSSGEFYNRVMKQCFDVLDSQLAVTGFPRNDLLFTPDNAIKRLIGDSHCKGYKKALLWMPTFRKSERLGGVDGAVTHTGFPLFQTDDQLSELNEQLKSLDLLMLIKLHPLQDLSGMDLKAFDNIKMLTNDALENANVQLYELVGDCDALLTDYSSVYFDYLLLDRPIGFIIDDIEDYLKSRGFVVENPLELMPGEKIKTIAELYSFLLNTASEKDDYKALRERLCLGIHTHRDGDSCKRIEELFLKSQALQSSIKAI